MAEDALKADLRRSIAAYQKLLARYSVAIGLVDEWLDRAAFDTHGYPYEEGYSDAMQDAATELLRALRGEDG